MLSFCRDCKIQVNYLLYLISNLYTSWLNLLSYPYYTVYMMQLYQLLWDRFPSIFLNLLSWSEYDFNDT